ncbi:hypothetical protein QLH52_22045 [Methylomonas sp. OY6]|uniref:Uncharacterized protein n=1 Tax=Methylomonas defluvii TaxID=3045149 RepID=A0ABU4UMS5_9GAMM|nr:hypothetical protein [Methylomonas sp. OY6]MDX8129989.1 hypothetical protein [Methylomonas sp. OY6]
MSNDTKNEKFRTMRIPIKSVKDSIFKTANGPDRPKAALALARLIRITAIEFITANQQSC